jgi:hypothetical protein
MGESKSQQVKGKVNLTQEYIGDEISSFVNSQELEVDVSLGKVGLGVVESKAWVFFVVGEVWVKGKSLYSLKLHHNIAVKLIKPNLKLGTRNNKLDHPSNILLLLNKLKELCSLMTHIPLGVISKGDTFGLSLSVVDTTFLGPAFLRGLLKSLKVDGDLVSFLLEISESSG